MDKVDRPKILLLSGYDASSHRYWREIISSHLKQYQWTQISLADRYFSWRVRGNSLTFAFKHKEALSEIYDCLIVTSMVDLSSLRGFIPSLAKIPTIVYFHENQFAYPSSMDQTGFEKQNIVNAQLTSIYSLLCADKILFNSRYNQNTFVQGAKNLLRLLPDGVPNGLIENVESKMAVVSVPIDEKVADIDLSREQGERADLIPRSENSTVEIVWNHRWEHDKQPEVLFAALALLKQDNIEFKLHILGQSFRNKPKCFEMARHTFESNIVTWGFQKREHYQTILRQADLVISTALHDFQGISMLEAIASGCIAIAPNRVAYPEYIVKSHLYDVGSGVDEVNSLYNKLIEAVKTFGQNNDRAESNEKTVNPIDDYLVKNLISKYSDVIDAVIANE